MLSIPNPEIQIWNFIFKVFFFFLRGHRVATHWFTVGMFAVAEAGLGYKSGLRTQSWSPLWMQNPVT